MSGKKLKQHTHSLKMIFLAALFATVMYIVFQMTNLFELNVNFFMVSVLSLTPLLFSALALNKDSRAKSVKIAFANLNALILFAVLTNLYFLIITLG